MSRLKAAGVGSSVGSIGDACDNAFADDQRALQGGGHIVTRTEAQLRTSDFSHAGMGQMVKQREIAGGIRNYAARRGRGALLCENRRQANVSVTQTKRPPTNPGQFNCKRPISSTERIDPLEKIQ
jgi:hypothetical protein